MISYADEHKCDLIGTGALKRLILGSLSLNLLRYAKCSVLVSRAS
ncbi:MAG: universal stress protein [Planctomycetales bacterium]|nr:universal stress protein [Planctomycetales bacterium]